MLRFSHTQDADELLDEDCFLSGPRFFLKSRIRQQENIGNLALANLLKSKDPGYPAHILPLNEMCRKVSIIEVQNGPKRRKMTKAANNGFSVPFQCH
ncbi:uncharacterized protein METZ01_LOCUS418926 [marine metagenome]|uniref:Uncharacterized protein n=1 Tax=marine metagenome TaxID=408172 RepID=A0A382X4Q4_9ZZZZ